MVITDLEMIENDPGIRAGHIVAGGVLEARDQVHQAHLVDVRQQLARWLGAVTPRTDLKANLANQWLGGHRDKSAADNRVVVQARRWSEEVD
nr:hypothetical protein OHB51_28700 [Micromonospora sp. NBC_00855]